MEVPNKQETDFEKAMASPTAAQWAASSMDARLAWP
jgi:hypothetical protein